MGIDLETLSFTKNQGLAELRLERPAARNGIDLQMARELQQVAVQCAGDASLRALLITASGPSFTVGGDLNFMAGVERARLPAVLKQLTSAYHQALHLLSRLHAPVVVAARGAAAGGGLGLFHAADFVLVADDLRVAMGFGALGLSMDGGNSWYLPKLVGRRRAAELYFEGRVLNAEEAVEWGLATRVVADDELEEQARALAQRLAEGPTLAFGEARDLLRGADQRTLADQLVLETEALSRCAGSEDAPDAIQAFLKKKTPVFRGR